jgi:transposase
MPKKLYVVKLLEAEKQKLRELIRKGASKARVITRAHTLLLADENRTDQHIADALHVGGATVERTRKKFVEGGVDKALSELPRPGQKRKLDGKQEAMVIALACSDPPQGRECWTMQLLADRVVELKMVDSLCDETVRRVLKKTLSSPGFISSGV